MRKDIFKTTVKLRSSISFILYSTLLYQINIAVKSKVRAISFRHKKKIKNLKNKQQHEQLKDDHPLIYIKHTVCNMSSYVLSDEEELAVSFGLDQHVPIKSDTNLINTEFEHYFQNIKSSVSNISDENILQLKTKLLSTCGKYNNLKVPYKHRQVIKRLAENKDIIISRQDKGKGVVIMERGKYTEKCLNMLNSSQFTKLDHDPTKAVENKIKRALRKIKHKLYKQDYIRLYPTGSAPGKFYGTAKKRKMSINGTIEDLPLRPIVSNIGTASYHLAKHLAKILSPLSKSEYTVDSTTYFIKCVRKMKIPAQHHYII